MSYREVRNFTEMMRALGYPRLISVENFRSPNFPLVAEILMWLVKRYDPNADIPGDTDTEQDRVIFIKSVAQFMASKAHLKVNTKKLYMADGYAVKEILKITSLLYDSMKTREATEMETAGDDIALNYSFNITSKLGELNLTRQLTSEITSRGASLYDLLSKESELRDVRMSTLAKQLEITEIEKGIRNSIKGVEEEIQKTNSMIENVAADESNLEAKIEKKKTDLERNQKRLQTLKSVRPAFMDEYERLEQELEKLYEQYVLKFRCLAYLEQQLEELEKAEQEQIEEREQQVQKMVEKLQRDEILRGEDTESLDDITVVGEGEGVTGPADRQKPRRPQPAASGIRKDTTLRRVFGSMTGGDQEESLETDSDLDLDGEDDDGSEGSTDDELELEKLVATSKKIVGNHGLPDSDNDF